MPSTDERYEERSWHDQRDDVAAERDDPFPYSPPHFHEPPLRSRSWGDKESPTFSRRRTHYGSQTRIHYSRGPHLSPHASSSFESTGHHPPPHYVISGPMFSYQYGHTVPPNSFYPPPHIWGPPPKPVEYIRNIKSTDVLCGRGGATNSHPGNRSFRGLVKRQQERYLKAKKRDKPSVASYIVDLIRERGGRFLRRCETTTIQGDVLWIDIGDERAREKTCQALREGAPELRRRRSRTHSSASSEEESEDKDNESPKKKLALSQDDDDSHGSPEARPMKESRSPELVTLRDARDDSENPMVMEDSSTNTPPLATVPITLRPCSLLMGRPVHEVRIGELSRREQELYLHDFYPPHPDIKQGSRRKSVVLTPRNLTCASSVGSDDESVTGETHENTNMIGV